MGHYMSEMGNTPESEENIGGCVAFFKSYSHLKHASINRDVTISNHLDIWRCHNDDLLMMIVISYVNKNLSVI